MSELDSILSIIVADSNLHARWINTFSHLEYVGFRKIVKSQHASFMDFETLSHAVEEGRHALLLKKLAMNVGGPKFNQYAPETMIAHQQAEEYFQTLDTHCEIQMCEMSDSLKARLTYLYVTWLVEIRALVVYSHYQKALKKIGMKSPLTGLLADEDRHLASVEREIKFTDPNYISRSEKLKRFEAGLYQNYIEALSSELMPLAIHA